MSMYTLLRNNPKPTNEEVLRCIEGNWCRCTGYRPILDAFSTFTEVIVLTLVCYYEISEFKMVIMQILKMKL